MRSIVPQAIAPDNEETYRRTVVAGRVALREAVALPVHEGSTDCREARRR
jgi:hypothetical protein